MWKEGEYAICKCGKKHRRSKTGPCPACYMQAYRLTEEGKKNARKADKVYAQRLPREKRKQYEYNWASKYQYRPTELVELNWANKFLERALASTNNGTGFSKPSERRRNQSIERRHRYGRGQNLRNADPSAGATAGRGSDAGAGAKAESES